MLPYPEILKTLPPAWPGTLRPENKKSFEASGRSLIVLDDDPTGTQTVHGVPVLCRWDAGRIAGELNSETPIFFILTNSRSLTARDAGSLALEIGQNIRTAEKLSGRRTLVLSRSDSTLRGHYPYEVHALGAGLGMEQPVHVIVPAFFEGGRFTLDDVHYVLENGRLQPAGQTVFARDASFGYTSSNLREWVAEKTGGQKAAAEVASISLFDLRTEGPQKVCRLLSSLVPGQVCIVNAMEPEDLDVFSTGFLHTGRCHDHILIRSAASFIPALVGMEPRPILGREDLNCGGRPGLIAVGSYVPKTTAQLELLQHKTGMDGIELRVPALLGEDSYEQEISRVAGLIDHCLESGNTALLYTSRHIHTGVDAGSSLAIVNRVSGGLTEVIGRMKAQPSFIIAKGGITSSDIATKALGLKKAMVAGQALAGVPVWQLEESERFAGMKYLPFPGNVGDDEALYHAYLKFV